MPPPTKVKVNIHAQTRHTAHLNIGDDVEFVSPADCTVYFTDATVFGVPELDLTAGQPVVLTVIGQGTTQFSSLEPEMQTTSNFSVRVVGSPNDIVVP